MARLCLSLERASDAVQPPLGSIRRQFIKRKRIPRNPRNSLYGMAEMSIVNREPAFDLSLKKKKGAPRLSVFSTLITYGSTDFHQLRSQDGQIGRLKECSPTNARDKELHSNATTMLPSKTLTKGSRRTRDIFAIGPIKIRLSCIFLPGFSHICTSRSIPEPTSEKISGLAV
ncbi:11926_t:CDS:2 [Acaulospora morrowiae]|uniref:11926_t:CDS:1 n=1 Tax=Acaulospora morrowiae TaxID=94023 RepID=A0A9N9DFL6_9GLOM|nr:11926_t:CDS:2 [Acaulospora morrowiae]